MFNFIKKMDIVHQSAKEEEEKSVVESADSPKEPSDNAVYQIPQKDSQVVADVAVLTDKGQKDNHQPDHNSEPSATGAGGGGDHDSVPISDHPKLAELETELRRELEGGANNPVDDHKQTETESSKDGSADKHHEVAATVEQSQRGPETLEVSKRDNSGEVQIATEVQEVTSSTRIDHHPSAKSMRGAARRTSYQSSRSYSGSFQNYGLTYLPYKSNFEPSEDARRRADEFFKTLKL